MTDFQNENYYTPPGGRLGDVIPFGYGGRFHIFFLDYRAERFDFIPPGARKTSWGHLVSDDTQSWRRVEDAIEPSLDGVDAASCATGSVIEHEGVFHLYYTGRSYTAAGDKREVVCEAISKDLIHWSKRAENPVLAPDLSTDCADAFRDPHVCFNPASGDYMMLVTTTAVHGRAGRSGALALARSTDLISWQRDGFFWNPGISVDLECPDIFTLGDWWYLLYSTGGRTRYRYATSAGGPWVIPPDDLFDSQWFYAAKTAQVEGDRVAFGWLAEHQPATDEGALVWGGALVTRWLEQQADGSLRVRPRPTAALSERKEPVPPAGDNTIRGSENTSEMSGGFDIRPFAKGGDVTLQIDAVVPASGRFGLLLHTDPQMRTGYRITLDIGTQTLSWSRLSQRGEPLLITRPCELHAGETIQLNLTVAGTVIDVIAGGSAFSSRAYDARDGVIAIWSEGASVQFRYLLQNINARRSVGPIDIGDA